MHLDYCDHRCRSDDSSSRVSRFLAALIAALASTGSLQAQIQSSEPTGAMVITRSANGTVPVKSWKAMRDERIVKQDLDYSCGAASLATLLNGYYGQNVTEESLLKAIDKGDLRASFEDMQRALLSFGFNRQGTSSPNHRVDRPHQHLSN